MDGREIPLDPLGVLVGHSNVALAERTTQRYLQNVNPASCLGEHPDYLSCNGLKDDCLSCRKAAPTRHRDQTISSSGA